ncbi:MAG: PEP/pyruvate-binding domain-containing protein [Elusimicrobia bacterium]|nr:PEP/pyruvate-binding domain-containing protein [Elusimicrobiota bacterium]
MKLFTNLFSAPLPPDAGGKAAGLRALREAGFTVPPTWLLRAAVVERLFKRRGGSCALRPAWAPELGRQARRLFDGRFPVIVRSSACDEDRTDSPAAGVYTSMVVSGREGLADALGTCAASAFGARAADYRRAQGRRGGAAPMALLVQPWLAAECGGVATLYHSQRLVVELAPGGSAGVTSGRAAAWRAIYELAGSRALHIPPGAPAAAMDAAAAAVLEVQRALYPNQNVSVELLVKRGHCTLLQARPLVCDGRIKALDMDRVYLRIFEMMQALGFRDNEWALGETIDVLAYNYLDIQRKRNETLEHFIVFLFPRGLRRARAQGWIVARRGMCLTLFPDRDDARRQQLMAKLSREGLLFIFCRYFQKYSSRSRAKVFMSGGRSFKMRFAVGYTGFTRGEARFLRRRLDRASAFQLRERLDYEELWSRRVRARLLGGARAPYERRLCRMLERQIRISQRRRRIVSSFLRASGGGAQRPPGAEVRGLPLVPQPRVVEGTAVMHRDILRARWRSFIYVAHDLEPSFLHRLDRLRAVLVSRGAFGSHAAALCAQFGVPLLVETRNISRLRTGDRLRVDLSDGRVSLARPHARSAGAPGSAAAAGAGL